MRTWTAGAVVSVALLLTAAAAADWPRRPPSPPEPPAQPHNIIVVFADDLGWGDLEPFGQTRIRTPRLAAMAAEGAILRQMYSAAPFCPPARDGLLSGRHTGHTQIRTSGVLAPDSAAAPRYLPRLLAAAGFATGVFGKWGLGEYTTGPGGRGEITAGDPVAVGFAEFLGTMTHRDAHTHTLPPFPRRPGDEPIHGRLWRTRGNSTREDWRRLAPFTQDLYLEAALNFIRRHHDEPFFLYLPWTLPHAELYLPPRDPAWNGYLDNAGESVFPENPFPGDSRYRRPNPHPRATYAAMVTRFDRDVGRLLDQLEALGLGDDTLVLVTSDNGPHAAGGIGGPAFFGSAGGLAGMKFSLLEGGIRVPAIVRWPRAVAAGRVIDEPVALWDLLPTFAELAGATAPAGVDGVSLAPLLRDEPTLSPLHDAGSPLYWEAFTNFRGQAARIGRYKALRPRLAAADDPVLLFDLEADPGETTNLARRPVLCGVLLDLIRVMNRERTDPGGELSFPALREECSR